MYLRRIGLCSLAGLLALLAGVGCRLPTDSLDPEEQERALGRRAQKAITAFSFAGLDSTGAIDESTKTIAVSVPGGTDVTTLVATFTTTGSSVRVGSVVQESGVTANDFSNPVIYTVKALNGSMASYTVTVTGALSSAKALTGFSFADPGVSGSIDEGAGTVTVAVPAGTDVTALVATFSTTGTSVAVGSTVQVSGETANDFAGPVEYAVTAEDGSVATYVVTVTVGAVPVSSDKAITVYRLPRYEAQGTIDHDAGTIVVSVPQGSDITSLVAEFGTTGASVWVGSVQQVSLTTGNDFTTPVVYTVEARDGSTRDYTVTVTLTSSLKAINYFELRVYNPYREDYRATIDEAAKTIAVLVPYGTPVTSMIARWTTTAPATLTIGSTAQVNDTTPNDFSMPLIYTVTALDGSSVNYTVKVSVAPPDPLYAIISFGFPGVAYGVVDGNARTIKVTVPAGTHVTSLVASYTGLGTIVRIGGVVQVNGVTANDFSGPVVYDVTLSSGLVVSYTVTVVAATSSAKAITAFSFPEVGAVGVINEGAKTIQVTVPHGTQPYLVPTIISTGANVSVDTYDFRNPVTATVTAADGSTVAYTVTAHTAVSSHKAMIEFSGAVIDEAAKTILWTLPYGTDVRTLKPYFATNGGSVWVGSTRQSSGFSSNNFTNPVVYTVRATDGSAVNYTVTARVASSKGFFSYFSFVGFFDWIDGNVSTEVPMSIDTYTKTIRVTLPYGTDVTALVARWMPTLVVKIGFTLQENAVTANDFSSPITYTVTEPDGTTSNHTVIVEVAPASAKAITGFSMIVQPWYLDYAMIAGGSGLINEDSKTIEVWSAPVVPVYDVYWGWLDPLNDGNGSVYVGYAFTGASLAIESVTFPSWDYSNYRNPVRYTVTATDGSTATYTVRVLNNEPF